jgi:ligand-binding sensor domain-containing protein
VGHVSNGTITFIDTTHGLPPNGGHTIVEARDGTMWFSGHDGVYTYDPKTAGARAQRKYATEAHVGTDRSGHIWVSTRGRVYRWEGEVAHEFHVPVPKEPPAVFSIRQHSLVFQMEDSKGNFWFSTDGHGAFRYDGKNFTHFTKKEGLCSNTPWDIEEDREGRIWFACIQAYQPTMTNDGGLCVFEPNGTFTTFPDVVGLHNNDLYRLYLDRDGNLWSSALRTGVYRINADGFTLFNTTDRPDLNGYFGLQAMVQDRKGTIWCGFSGGLFRLQDNTFVNVPRGGPWE